MEENTKQEPRWLFTCVSAGTNVLVSCTYRFVPTGSGSQPPCLCVQKSLRIHQGACRCAYDKPCTPENTGQHIRRADDAAQSSPHSSMHIYLSLCMRSRQALQVCLLGSKGQDRLIFGLTICLAATLCPKYQNPTFPMCIMELKPQPLPRETQKMQKLIFYPPKSAKLFCVCACVCNWGGGGSK